MRFIEPADWIGYRKVSSEFFDWRPNISGLKSSTVFIFIQWSSQLCRGENRALMTKVNFKPKDWTNGWDFHSSALLWHVSGWVWKCSWVRPKLPGCQCFCDFICQPSCCFLSLSAWLSPRALTSIINDLSRKVVVIHIWGLCHSWGGEGVFAG